MPLLSVGSFPVAVPIKTRVDAALEDQSIKQTITKTKDIIKNLNQIKKDDLLVSLTNQFHSNMRNEDE
jgi:hypothetical protein